MLNKVEAAEYLGCTTRTLERHIKEKKIGVTYQQSKFGDVAMFDPQELENFKQGKQTTRIKPAITEDRPAIEQPTTPQNQFAGTPQTQPESTFTLTAHIAPLGAWFGNLTNAINNHSSRVTAIELRSKLLLTLDEAQIVTGLSREILLDAIKNGELPSKMMSKVYRIKTQDLERYIADLDFSTN